MMRHKRTGTTIKSILMAVALALFICTVPAASLLYAGEVEDASPGFYLGLTLMGSSLHADDTAGDIFRVQDDGGGAMLLAGYHFTPTFALELSAGGANHETNIQELDANLGLVQIFAVYRFVPGQQFRPYIKGGVGGYGLSFNGDGGDVTAKGGGLAFGGGFSFFFTPHFALGVDFTHNIIKYDQIELSFQDITVGTEIDEEGSMSSLGLSFGYFF